MSLALQSSPKIFESPMNIPFPLQCGDVTAKVRGYNNWQTTLCYWGPLLIEF